MTISDLTLERLALDELDPQEAADARRRLEEDGELHRLDELRASNEEVLAAFPPEEMVPRIRARFAEAEARGAYRRGWWSGLGVGVAVAAAALLLTWLGPARSPTMVPEPEVTRLKGLAPHLVVHRKLGDVAERLRDGASVRPGDLLQLGYVAAEATHGVIVSLDGDGVVTLHQPEFGTLPTALAGDGRVDLPFAYELDAAAGFERFVFVTSDAPLDVDAVLAAARAVARGDDPAGAPLEIEGAEQSSVVLRKGGTP